MTLKFNGVLEVVEVHVRAKNFIKLMSLHLHQHRPAGISYYDNRCSDRPHSNTSYCDRYG